MGDGTDVDIKSFQHEDQAHLLQALRQIHEYLLQGKRVLVCCQQGKDRSALVVVAYLMALYGISVEVAYKYVQYKRPIVSTLDIPDYRNFLIDEFSVSGACL